MIQHYYTGMSTAFSRCEETRIQHKERLKKKKRKIDHMQKELGLLIR